MELLNNDWKPTWLSAFFVAVGLMIVRIMRPHRPRTAQDYLATQLAKLPHLPDFEWNKNAPLQFCPFMKTGPLNTGLQRIDPGEWLLVDSHAAEILAKRRSYIEKWTDGRLFIESEQSRGAICELWTLATTFAAHKYPRVYTLAGGLFFNHINDTSAPADAAALTSREILLHLSLMFEEDFILLCYEDEAEEYAVQAANHVHPTGFNPVEILGATLSQLHAPVPGYQERLRNPMARFFARLSQGTLMQRLNWSCQEGDLLCLPSSDSSEVMQIKSRDGAAGKGAPAMDPTKMNIRVERQTLQRLPQSQYVLFTVRTYLYPLEDLKVRGYGAALRRAIHGLDWHFGQYKGKQNWGDTILGYLGSI